MTTKARQLREEKGITQMDVALKTGVHPSLISRLENGDGRPGLDGLIRIARFYGVNVEDLVEVAYGKQDAEPAAEGAQ